MLQRNFTTGRVNSDKQGSGPGPSYVDVQTFTSAPSVVIAVLMG
jgi:hypothetical protein